MKQASIEKSGIARPKPPNIASRMALTDKSAAMGKSSQASLDEGLLNAAEAADTRKMESLLNAGAGIEAKDSEGMTPLMLAAWLGRSKGCIFLLNRGANIEATDSRGWTPLMHAANHLRKETCALLVLAGANIEALSRTGKTASMLAKSATAGKVATFSFLNSIESIKGSIGKERFDALILNFRECISR
jgi:ankyrin repeat protein